MKRSLLRTCALATALGLIVSCSDNPTVVSKPATAPVASSPLKFDPLNGEAGACLSQDAFDAGHTNGVNGPLDLAKQKADGSFTSCTANDISIATATIPPNALISVDGGTTFIPYAPPIACTKDHDIILDLSVDLTETATSSRTDIGIWIGLNGGNARTGQCNHYNLITAANRILDGKSPFAGVQDIDQDNCGDMNAASSTSGGAVQLGQLTVKCSGTTGLVHIGSCLTWKVPAEDGDFCPSPNEETPTAYRFGTTPTNTAKCNCGGFDVPIEIGGSIKIIKNTIGGDGAFDFTNDIGTHAVPTVASPFTLTTVGGTNFVLMPNVRPGTYHVTESGPPAGWSFTSLVCTGNGTGGTTSTTSSQAATIVIPVGGGDVVCTFTNTVQPGTLVIKKISNDGIGTFNFTSTGAALPSPASGGAFSLTTTVAGTAVQQSFTVVPGTAYGVSESAKAGWTFNGRACVITTAGGGGSSVPADGTTQPAAITVGAGATVTCTYTNTLQPGTLVIKKVSNGSVGTFDFTSANAALPSPAVSGAFSLTTTVAGTAVQESFTVVPGTSYGVSESAKAGWTFDGRACVVTTVGGGGSSIPADGKTQPAAITVGAGATVTCTYTNTQQGGTLVIKKVSNDGIGTFNFTSSGAALPSPADASGAFSLTTTVAGTAVQQSFNVVPGTAYGVSESAKAGWTFNGRVCAITTAGDGTSSVPADGTTQPAAITVGAGATVTCTYTNTQQPGTLIIKKVSNDGIGTFNFTSASAALPSPASGGAFSLTTTVAGTAVQQSFTVVPGTSYGVSESAKTGWTFNGRACVVTTVGGGGSSIPADGTTQPAAITVGAGATVTCTYTNTLQPGTLVIKKVSNAGIGTFDFTSSAAALPSPAAAGAFSLTTTVAGTAVQQSFTVVPGTSYGVSESAKTGWTFNGRACVVTTVGAGGSSIPADGTTQPAAITVGAGATVTCTYTNTKLAKLTIIKTVKGKGATFPFSSVGDGLDATFNLVPADNASDSKSYSNLASGLRSFTEGAHAGYLLTDLGCANTVGGAAVGGPYDPKVTSTVSVTLAAGDDITCTFVNEEQPTGQTTRTQGFWATHTTLTEAVWFGLPFQGVNYTGIADKTFCNPVTKDLNTLPRLMAGFWASISQITDAKGKNASRSPIDQARMQLVQQLLAAILNNAAFNSAPQGITIDAAKAAYCGSNIDDIKAAAQAMALFNESGDNGVFTPGASANGKLAKDTAAPALSYWNILP